MRSTTLVVKRSFNVVSNIGALAFLLMCGCDSPRSAEDARRRLAGTYELVVGLNQTVSREDFQQSTLVLSGNGRFLQDCFFKGGHAESIRGDWNYARQKIFFSIFKDCAGVWPAEFAGGGANLLLESGLFSSPVILLSPDVNVYYRRLHGKTGESVYYQEFMISDGPLGFKLAREIDPLRANKGQYFWRATYDVDGRIALLETFAPPMCLATRQAFSYSGDSREPLQRTQETVADCPLRY